MGRDSTRVDGEELLRRRRRDELFEAQVRSERLRALSEQAGAAGGRERDPAVARRDALQRLSGLLGEAATDRGWMERQLGEQVASTSPDAGGALPPVQLEELDRDKRPDDPDEVRSRARKGVSGAGQRLPHLDTIQRAFGRHDVSRIRAHLGGGAADAARSIGARAFTHGLDIAFGAAPGLRLASHEAAHALQQQGGHAPPSGVGVAGDRLEQHADAVADAVVSGRSAEPILDSLVGRPAGSPALGVQREELPEREKDAEGGDREDDSSDVVMNGEAQAPGTTLEFNWEIKKHKQHSASFRISLAKKKNKLVKAKVGADSDGDGKVDKDSLVTGGGSLLDNKATLKKSSKGVGKELASALGKVDVGVSPFSWLKVKIELKGAEAKMKFGEKTEHELALAKVAVAVEGKLPAAWVARHFGGDGELAEKLDVKIQGKYEYKIPFDDYARLLKMHEASEDMIKHGRKIDDLAGKWEAADKREKWLKGAKRDKAYRKRFKEAAKARGLNPGQAWKQHKIEIDAERQRLKKLKGRLRSSIEKRRGIIKRAKGAYQSAAKGLKSKAGKAMGKVLGKTAGKVLGKIAAKLVPGLNIISTALDIYEIATKMDDLLEGRLKFGLGGGGSGDGDAAEGTEGSGGAGGEGGEAGAGGEGGAEGAGGGYGPNALEGGEAVQVDPADLEVEDPYEREVEPNAQAKPLLDALQVQEGLALEDEHVKLLNDSLPDLSPAERQKLLERLKPGKGERITDPYALVGEIIQSAHQVKEGLPIGTNTAEGEVTVTEAQGTPGDSAEKQKKKGPDAEKAQENDLDYERAARLNAAWQKSLGWDVGTLTGGEQLPLGSRELADWIARYQASNGLGRDGVAGPKTIRRRYAELELTDSPVYKKAVEIIERAEDRKQARQGGEPADASKKGPAKVFRFRPKDVVRWDDESQTVVVTQALKDAVGQFRNFPDGLSVQLTGAQMLGVTRLKGREGEDSVYRARLEMTGKVVGMPDSVPAGYRYSMNQVVTETEELIYDPEDESLRRPDPILQSMKRASRLFDVSEDAVSLKAGAAQQTIDFLGARMQLQRIVGSPDKRSFGEGVYFWWVEVMAKVVSAGKDRKLLNYRTKEWIELTAGEVLRLPVAVTPEQ